MLGVIKVLFNLLMPLLDEDDPATCGGPWQQNWREWGSLPHWQNQEKRSVQTRMKSIISIMQVKLYAFQSYAKVLGKKEHANNYLFYFLSGYLSVLTTTLLKPKQGSTRHRPMAHSVVLRYLSYSTTLQNMPFIAYGGAWPSVKYEWVSDPPTGWQNYHGPTNVGAMVKN